MRVQLAALFVALCCVAPSLGHRDSRLREASFGPEPEIASTFNIDAAVPRLAKRHGSSRSIGQVLSVVNRELGLSYDDYLVKNVHTSKHTGTTHVYLKQLLHGVEVANGDLNVSIDRYGTIASLHSTFVEPHVATHSGHSVNTLLQHTWHEPPQQQTVFGLRETRAADHPVVGAHISPIDALNLALQHLGLAPIAKPRVSIQREDAPEGSPHMTLLGVPNVAEGRVPASLRFIQTREGTATLCWELELEMRENWFVVQVAASKDSAEVVSLVDWVADAAYRVYPLGTNDPLDGERQLLTDPADAIASPLGWHNTSNATFVTTRGNNAIAQENFSGAMEWRENYRPAGGVGLAFDFELDLSSDPKTYIDAAVTNLFYWTNTMHDLFYRYGFDEESGNFQDDNLRHGGLSGDAVIADAQDGSGFDNANFATPPDGRHGKMRMYVWDETEPKRDGDLESGIIIHEYAHGISTRLTGGPANSNCLGWGEAGGMGEGWGDFFATILRMQPEHTRDKDFLMGAYANAGEGIRKFAYSTSMTTNPSTYSFLNKVGYWGVHAKGEVWAVMLYEVYWNLVDKHGFTLEWFSASPHYGNTLALQLVVDAMKLQPCRPGFIEARDAILLADQQLTNGGNRCDIWRAFAKRGLGPNAKIVGKSPWGGGIRRDDFDPPSECVA